ncbi:MULTISPECIES: protein phosphatase 2C domain-containing protein [Nostoc]|uniref:Protein phosphatase 2C domain-containing protein n=1 Tax=Nostoc paludosum FACHB-159 TaxID=2692908 RepID=A0ABR8K6V6_9NOSO|nr:MULTISPECIES: protein phosphatase 2C domain-containing protein [Nostoc]MBD2683381.1 protein phosphatase 2C domain-containing protein [Nostoc sp. FACHB-857]MBD2734063.1 protein phosphatase 2C domain-containing protein [Nostoc paludosum FACHB-159]
MISIQPKIYCINPTCNDPINPEENAVCASCQTPLVRRYLWAVGSVSATIPPGTKVANRYDVIRYQVWLDSQPGLLPDVPEQLPKAVIPYLRLYQERLHLPQVYGFARGVEEGAGDILLLENVPIDETGHIYPSITEAWEQATAVRQVYWLWQILQLWTPLSEWGLSRSLLVRDNLRVQGWCVRLLQLYQKPTVEKLSLRHLGLCWQPWVASAKTSIAKQLQNIVQQMCETQVELDAIATQLNHLLLASAAELPLSLKVAGSTDTGKVMPQNEDTCYPNALSDFDDRLLPQLSIVCDGIGGHEGGEVASRLAVESVKLQIRVLLAEVAAQNQLVSPQLLQEQLEASLRVANNVISARNDEQNRQGRERMATTIVMAVQVPQRIETISGWQSNNSHELYLAHVGDSRAYWITPNYCQLLTIDDDVAAREVRFAKSLYRQALLRPDATALTQALGTRDSESLRLTVGRFILEEDGILLLCSDGLSDRNWVEQYWQDYIKPVFAGEVTLEDAVSNWINLANEKNGRDNISVVLTYCRVSPEYVPPVTPTPPVEIVEPEIEQLVEPEELPELEEPISLTESSEESLDLDLDLDIPEEPVTTPTTPEIPPTLIEKPRLRKRLLMLGGVLALLAGGTGIGLFAWWQINPQGFGQVCRQLPARVQQVCPGKK